MINHSEYHPQSLIETIDDDDYQYYYWFKYDGLIHWVGLGGYFPN